MDKSGKLILPPTPDHDDHPALCRWLTVAFNLDPHHPVTGAARRGLHGPKGQAYVYRAGGAPAIAFDPISTLANAPRLIETLAFQTIATDGVVRDFKPVHCRQIAHVVSMISAVEGAITESQLAAGIVGDLTMIGEEVTGLTTRGTSQQRYEAACAFMRPTDEWGRRSDRPRYLVDAVSGELVISVGELATVARGHIGGSLTRGYLEGIMEELGWQRLRLQGHERVRPDRGRHRRIDVYRGVLEVPDED